MSQEAEDRFRKELGESIKKLSGVLKMKVEDAVEASEALTALVFTEQAVRGNGVKQEVVQTIHCLQEALRHASLAEEWFFSWAGPREED